MKLITTTAIALVAAAAATPAAAQYGASAPQQQTVQQAPAQAKAAQVQIKPSGKALKAIVDLQDTVKKNDFANVPAKVAAAQAVASTKEDRYLIGKLQLDAALAQKDNTALASAIDTIAGSGYLDASKVAGLYMDLGGTYYNNKQYAQARAAYEKVLAADPRNVEAPALIGESLFALGQKAEAAAAFQRAIQARVAAGQKPDENLLKRATVIAYDAGSPIAAELGRQWVTSYPSPESWRNSIAIYRNLNHPDVQGTLDLLRLMQATGALTVPSDYSLFARASAEQSNYNEAQAVIDAGIAAKVVKPADPEFRDIIAGLKTKNKATVADLETAEKTAQNPSAYMRIGDWYYAMGRYAKAADVYRKAIGKAGVDSNVANLHLGMALARSGDKPGATAALNAVSGTRADIAKFWLAYVNQH